MLKKHVYFFHGMTPLEVIMSGLKKGGKIENGLTKKDYAMC
jgi:hypothetical protein